MISKIETHSLNALPALRSEDYDGWRLRFANGHTRRANSVNILKPGDLPLEQKVIHCEEAYKRVDQPYHFRLTPLADPSLDDFLEDREYGLHDPTEVRILPSLGSMAFSSSKRVSVSESPTEDWLEALARLTDQSSAHQKTFLQIIQLSSLKTRFASIVAEEQIVSCGLGIASKNFIGLFEFATNPEYQRQGMARDIVHTLLADAIHRNIDTAYLQVVTSNAGGSRFWRDIGFDHSLYSYHYRSKSGA